MSEVRNLLRQTNDYLDFAARAESRGQINAAVDYYLDAAQKLFLAARLTKGRLKEIRIANAEAIISTATALSDRLDVAERVRGNPDFQKGVEILNEMGIDSSGKSGVTFDDVGGLSKVKKEVRSSIIEPMRHPELAKRYNVSPGGGILMYGPPGTGKTHIAKAIANEVDAFFINVKVKDLVSQWFGNFEKNIGKLFQAVKLCAPTVLFLDEVDGLVPRRRGSSSSVIKRAIPQLLQEISGIGDISGKTVLIIAATNNPWELDEAIMRPGRFDEKIYIPPPDWEARRRIFEIHLKTYRLDNVDYDECASLTEGYSGADIWYICQKSGRTVFMDAVQTGVERPIDMDDIISVINDTPPSITEKALRQYEKFRDELHRSRN